MFGTMITICANGATEFAPLNRQVDLEKIQKVVGGWIKQIPFFDVIDGKPCIAFCNEDGQNLNLPLNTGATLLWYNAMEAANRFTTETLVGDIVIFSGDEEFLKTF